MGELEPGLYESLVTDELAEQLESLERLTAASRRHAKAWVFHRHTGFSTAYIE